ncbi:MAG: hypothetical protein J7J92_02925 [Candidatus Aenigmarchaeota archaeon]|nr:hypothetical protein [Candidatus Aenigmarchaeota archaeon]
MSRAMEIKLVPVDEIPAKIIQELEESLSGLNIDLKIMEQISIPESFNRFRRQHSVERIFDSLDPKKYKNAILLTKEDIYDRNTGYVFHAGEIGGPGIVSYFRLRPSFYREKINFDLLIIRIKKEIIHVIGHIIGLEECQEPCVMGRSSSIGSIDKKSEHFCKNCKIKMSTMGIELE